jgi:hypothetical protein
VLLLLPLLLFGCEPDPVPPLSWERPGRWFAGDLHVHTSVGSNDTDGLGTVAFLADTARARGLDFVFITDHSNAAGSMDCETGDVEDCPNRGPEFPAREASDALSDASLALWVGSELSPIQSLEENGGPNGHIGCHPVAAADFGGWEDAFVDRPPGSVSGADALAQCQAIGGFSVVNHPDAIASWVAWDDTSDMFDGVEIYGGNAQFDRQDEAAIARWMGLIAAGRSVVAVGGSDVHRFGTEPPGSFLDPALGYPRTSVWATSLAEVPRALAAGQVVVHEPPSMVELLAQRGEGQREAGPVGPGGSVMGPAEARLRASAGVDGLRVEVVDAWSGDVIYQADLAKDEDVEAFLTLTTGAWVARLWPADAEWSAPQGGVAVANPVWVE